jgi:acetyltransferase-like isoleucine patch superfamily enzyme
MRLWQSLTSRLAWQYRLHNVARLPYKQMGVNVVLHNGSILFPPGKIRLGSHIYVGPEAYFWADGGLTIHDNVIFGPRVAIFTSNHQVEGADCLPYGALSETAEVVVHSNTWVGAYCVILPGVRIGEGAVLAAGSVVSKNVPPLAFVAGNPAVVKRYRDPEHYLRLKSEGKFFMKLRAESAVEYRYVPRERPTGPMAETAEAAAQRARLELDRLDLER